MIILCFWPSWGIPDRLLRLQMFVAFMRWEGEGWKQLQLPQHGARGCLYCCYYGDVPLHAPLCNKVLKFIYLRMKAQWASTPQREGDSESVSQSVLVAIKVVYDQNNLEDAFKLIITIYSHRHWISLTGIYELICFSPFIDVSMNGGNICSYVWRPWAQKNLKHITVEVM